MARFGLWVAVLSLVCLVIAVTSDNDPQTNPDANICGQFFNDGSTMTISRVFDMLIIQFRDYVPDLGTELVRMFMREADLNQDERLNQDECEHLIQFVKNRTPGEI